MLERTEMDRRRTFYTHIEIKKLVMANGAVQWYGCEKNTQRCPHRSVLGTADNGISRYTPPCCLQHLQDTLLHVVKVLKKSRARYWLEAETLSGVVQKNALLPWSNHSEVGIHWQDSRRVKWLWRAMKYNFVTDDDEFYWEHIKKNNYYRVAYSTHNRMYVNIYPFSSDNFTMAMNFTGVERQRSFPAHHLNPLNYLKLDGEWMPVPNKARMFLKLKLGEQFEKNDGWI